MIALIENTDESILCDKLLGNNAVPTLRERFNDIRIYRNDVMHSHYTNWKRFKEILSLYKAVNDELNNNLCNIVANGSKYHINPAFNQILEVALMAQEQIYEVFDVLKPGLEQLKLPLAEIQEKIK